MSQFAPPHSARSPHHRRAARWLALGDSYTVGEGVAAHESWPMRLAALLAEAGDAAEPPHIVATTGWTAAELLTGMEAAGVWPAREHYDIVSLLVGVNDQYRGRSPAEFAPDYARCAERAVTLAGGQVKRVLGLSIPDWGVTRFAAGSDRAAIAHAIDAFNAKAHAHLMALDAHWCDITALSRRHGADAAFLAADGLHPGAAAYIEWARLALPVARSALAGDGGRGR